MKSTRKPTRHVRLPLALFSIAALAAAPLACSDDVVPTPAANNTPPPASASVYASDAAYSAPVVTDPPPPAKLYDAAPYANDAADGGAAVCAELAVCCKQQKVCAEETAACNDVVKQAEPIQCALTLSGYKVIGCAHDDSVPPPSLPTFQGCTSGGGDFWTWLFGP